MSAHVMGLLRELKALNARKKAGEPLSTEEETRRKELKVYLKAQLESGGGGEDTGTTSPPQRVTTNVSRAPTSAVSNVSQPPVPAPVPAAVVAASAPKAAPRPVSVAQAPAPAPVSTPPPPPRVAAPTQPPVMSSRPAPVPVATPTPPPGSKKDAYMISGIEGLFEAASNSEAVNRTARMRRPSASASEGDIADAEAAADAAVRANKKRPRATTPEEVEAQLKQGGGTYTPPASDFVLEQYYGDYFEEGLQPAEFSAALDLAPIDPRELQFRQALDVAMGGKGGATSAAVPAGLAFLDDYPVLYARNILPVPTDAAPAVADDPSMLIGRRKVTIHLINGEKKQGLVRGLRRGELAFKLDVNGAMEDVTLQQVKAVFVHLQGSTQPPHSEGKSITVTFLDQRTVSGDSADYSPNAPVFTLVPPAGRGQFERIIVNMQAVASVS
jgi:hypothetical protein